EIPCPECACDVDAPVACYDGDEKTRGVGSCKDGTSTCTPDGGQGKCVGQVLPAPDDCVTDADEDCDGEIAKCTGTTTWQKSVPGSFAAFVTDMAVSDTGVYVAGMMDSTGLGAGDAFVAKFDASGSPLWTKTWKGTLDSAYGVAVSATGKVVVAGGLRGETDF